MEPLDYPIAKKEHTRQPQGRTAVKQTALGLLTVAEGNAADAIEQCSKAVLEWSRVIAAPEFEQALNSNAETAKQVSHKITRVYLLSHIRMSIHIATQLSPSNIPTIGRGNVQTIECVGHVRTCLVPCSQLWPQAGRGHVLCSLVVCLRERYDSQ